MRLQVQSHEYSKGKGTFTESWNITLSVTKGLLVLSLKTKNKYCENVIFYRNGMPSNQRRLTWEAAISNSKHSHHLPYLFDRLLCVSHRLILGVIHSFVLPSCSNLFVALHWHRQRQMMQVGRLCTGASTCVKLCRNKPFHVDFY